MYCIKFIYSWAGTIRICKILALMGLDELFCRVSILPKIRITSVLEKGERPDNKCLAAPGG